MLGYSFGALGAVAVVGSFFLRLFESSIIPISLLTGVWAMTAAYPLYRLGREV